MRCCDGGIKAAIESVPEFSLSVKYDSELGLTCVCAVEESET